jgi:hypothetical protein
VDRTVGVEDLAKHEDVVIPVERIANESHRFEQKIAEVTLGLIGARPVETPLGDVFQLLDFPVDDLRLRSKLGGRALPVDPDVLG